MAHPQLNWCTPMEKGLGVTPDISPFLQFEWYEPVLFLNNNDGFPSTKERKGYWCGPTENVGDAMTYWILTDDTKQLIARSNVRSALTPDVSASNVPINFRAVFSNDFDLRHLSLLLLNLLSLLLQQTMTITSPMTKKE